MGNGWGRNMGGEQADESWALCQLPDSTLSGLLCTCRPIHQPFACLTPEAGSCGADEGGGWTADGSGVGRLMREGVGFRMDKAYCCLLLGKKDPKLELPPEGVHFGEQGEITAQSQKEQILQGLSKSFSGSRARVPLPVHRKTPVGRTAHQGQGFPGDYYGSLGRDAFSNSHGFATVEPALTSPSSEWYRSVWTRIS